MITTVIFDLDGLLADTEPLHFRAYQDVLQPKGTTLTKSEYIEHWVRAGKGIREWVTDHRLDLNSVQLRVQKSKRYLKLLASSLRPMDGSLELLETLYGNKTLALASSAFRDAVNGVTEGLNIAHYFKVIVSGSEVPNVKPAPDIFLAAASQAGAAPPECVVVEDAEKGVLASY